jgi:hypothetical protein
MNQKIVISLSMPTPDTEQPRHKPKKCVETVVRELLDTIESCQDSSREWILIKKIYKKLESRRDPRSENIKKLIRPVLSHYGYHMAGREGDI